MIFRLLYLWYIYRNYISDCNSYFCTIHHGVKSVYKKYSCYILCIAVSNSRVGSSLSFEFASCGGARFHCKMIQEIGEYTLRLAQFSLSAIFSFASTVIELIVVPFITFYMMKKGRTFSNKFAELFPERYHAHIKNLFKEIHFVLKAYIHGQLLLSVLMAFLVFIGMWIMDIPYPLVIGLLAGVVEVVPIIGPIIGAVPPILLGLLQGSSVMIQVIIFYVVVQQLDSHFIMPKLMGSIIEVHPVAIIAGVLIGGSLKGILGMMIAVPAVAVLQILLRHMWYYDRYKVLR